MKRKHNPPVSKFGFDKSNYPTADAEDDERYGLFAWFLMSDVQTLHSCATIFAIIQDVEMGTKPEYAGIGNVILLTLNRDRAKVQVGIPITKKPLDYGAVNEMSFSEFKQLVKNWQTHLKKA
jgi:hypothetical protein